MDDVNQKCFKEWKARWDWRLASVVQSNNKASVVQIPSEVNADSDRKASDYTVLHSMLYMERHGHADSGQQGVLQPRPTQLH